MIGYEVVVARAVAVVIGVMDVLIAHITALLDR